MLFILLTIVIPVVKALLQPPSLATARVFQPGVEHCCSKALAIYITNIQDKQPCSLQESACRGNLACT